ncbi:unnamed protein product, partial [Mesorhabditis spiculigera]
MYYITLFKQCSDWIEEDVELVIHYLNAHYDASIAFERSRKGRDYLARRQLELGDLKLDAQDVKVNHQFRVVNKI